MDRTEKAGKLIAYGLKSLLNNDEGLAPESIDISDMLEEGYYFRVQRFENGCAETEQELADSSVATWEEEDGNVIFVEYQTYHRKEKASEPQATTQAHPLPAAGESRASQVYRAMRDFILSHKQVRRNLVTKACEWAEAGTEEFVTIDRQELATMWTRLKDNDIHIDFNFLQRFCEADIFDRYDPVADYMERLPAWDGYDHVGDFIQRLTTNRHCVDGMRLWLRAVAAKMMHFRDESPWANMLMPILVGAQGLKKTTFARRILPVEGFFTQNIDFSPRGDWMRKLTSYIVVCDDEFDRHNAPQLATIKAAISTAEVMMRDPYAKRETPHTRLAAMIGTSNRLDLLRDETGNRRFLVINVERPIDLDTPIPYEQIYAQLKEELLAGSSYYPQAEFERRNEVHNQTFRTPNIVEELFLRHYSLVPTHHPAARWLSTSEIYDALCALHPVLKREKPKATEFGKSLKTIVQRFATEQSSSLATFTARRKGYLCYCVMELGN